MRFGRFCSGLIGLFVALSPCPASADAVQDCRSLKDAAQSIRACTEVIQGVGYDRDQKAAALRLRGTAHAAAGAFDDALGDLSEAIRLRTDDAAAYAQRGQVRLSRKDQDGALADLNEAVRLDSDNASLFVLRGHAYLVGGRPDEAIADFSTAIGLNPGSASALNNRGLAYRKKGDLARAIENFSAAIAVAPLYALAYNNRGYAYEAQGRKADAIGDFRHALFLDPTLAGAKDGLRRLGEAGRAFDESAAYIQGGKALVEKNCGWCHATGRTGASSNPKAPEFRNIQNRHPLLALREPLSRGIVAPHDQMPEFALSEHEVDQVVAYINSLANAEVPAAPPPVTQPSAPQGGR
jgi:tetratricopeptide (TPR) repeat protein